MRAEPAVTWTAGPVSARGGQSLVRKRLWPAQFTLESTVAGEPLA